MIHIKNIINNFLFLLFNSLILVYLVDILTDTAIASDAVDVVRFLANEHIVQVLEDLLRVVSVL
jgi:hypothetical protein